MWKQKQIALIAASILGVFLSPDDVFARMINLPGTLASGVNVCTPRDRRCITTSADQETPVRVVSYQDGEGEAIVLYKGERYVAAANHVVVDYKGCRVSLGSFVQGRLCPGMRR